MRLYFSCSEVVIGIPLAGGALYVSYGIQIPPMVAGVCMAFSSVSVVLSSLMLRNYKKPKFSSREKSTGRQEQFRPLMSDIGK